MRTSLIIICIVLSVNAASISFGDPLTGVTSSPEYKKLFNKRPPKIAAMPEGVDAGSNYWNIFNSRGGKRLLTEWLGNPGSQFRETRHLEKGTTDYVMAQKTYVPIGESEQRIEVQVYAPFPRSFDAIQLKLIPEFLKLEPPGLAVTSTDVMILDGREGKFFREKKGGCALHIPLPRHVVLFLYSEQCKNPQNLVEVSESLDVDRLEQKLNS